MADLVAARAIDCTPFVSLNTVGMRCDQKALGDMECDIIPSQTSHIINQSRSERSQTHGLVMSLDGDHEPLS